VRGEAQRGARPNRAWHRYRQAVSTQAVISQIHGQMDEWMGETHGSQWFVDGNGERAVGGSSRPPAPQTATRQSVGRASRGHGQATPVCRRGLFRVQQGVTSSSQCGAWAGCMGCMGCMAGKGLGKNPRATQAKHVLSAEKMPLRLSVRETTARRLACSNCAAPRRRCLAWPTEAPALLGC
jgi:hypothetical protein